MKLLFKQRFFSWLDSYDIYDEYENTVYVVKGQMSWGHCLKIFDSHGREMGMVKERVLTFLPAFEVYEGGQLTGSISRELTFLKPRYNIDFNGWHIEGTFPYDGYLCSGYCESGRCTACTDVCAGNRCGEMFEAVRA